MMRVNEIVSRCRTDQSIYIHYDNRCIPGTVIDIIDTEEYRLNRVGNMLVTKIYAYKNSLFLEAVKA